MIEQIINGLPIGVEPAGEESGELARRRLEEACVEFEALLVRQMMRCMRSTVSEGGMLEKSSARKIYEEMLDDKLSEKIAHRGALGLSDILLRDLAGEGSESG